MFSLLHHPQKEELVPLLVSVGCQTGEFVMTRRKPSLSTSSSQSSFRRSQSRSPTSSTSSSVRRSVSRPRELPGCSSETPGQGRRGSVHPVEHAGSPAPEPNACGVSQVSACTPSSDQLQQYIERRFNASSSLNEDEALAITHQLRELQRERTK